MSCGSEYRGQLLCGPHLSHWRWGQCTRCSHPEITQVFKENNNNYNYYGTVYIAINIMCTYLLSAGLAFCPSLNVCFDERGLLSRQWTRLHAYVCGSK